MTAAHLADDFIDATAEAGLIAAIAADRPLFFRVADQLPPGAFTGEAGAWEALREAIEADKPFAVPDGAEPAGNIEAAIERLAELHRRRQLADVIEGAAQGLADNTKSARDVATALEDDASRISSTTRDGQVGAIQWVADLVPDLLADAAARRQRQEETGRPCLGIRTSIGRLDTMLGGLNPGLHLLAGAPGVGKTSLALQIAMSAAREIPVVYITYENAPANLALKALCTKAGVGEQDVRKGWADVAKLERAAAEWTQIADRLALIDGHPDLEVADVRARVLQAMHRHQTDQALVVIDYLQLMAKASNGLRDLGTIRERVERLAAELRAMVTRLNVPVLAVAAQSRQANYADGKGNAGLDTLKESGDLEYGADTVLILHGAKDRAGTPAMDPFRDVDLTVAKNRHGPTGKVELVFDPVRGVLTEFDAGA